MRLDSLYLWYLGTSTPRFVGELSLVAAGKGVSLRYGQDWLASGFPLSEDLPLVDTVFSPPGRHMADAPRAVGAVDDARPDRWGEKVIRFIDKPKRQSLMEFLYYAGDDRFGALGVSTSPSQYIPRPGGPLPRLEQAQDLSEVVAKIEEGEALTDLEEKIIQGGGSPLGGAKPKALIEIEGEQWVIKFANGEYVDAPLVEHATMTLAAKADIDVAPTRVIPLVGANAVAIKRFDRVAGRRIHSISAGTAIRAVTPEGEEPDLGYPELARILRRSGVARTGEFMSDAHQLFRRMVFNILMDNTDDHEKNHALLVVDPQANGRMRLAPAYDVLPTTSGQGHQEFICGAEGRDSTLANAMSECEAFGLEPQEAAQHVVKVIEVVSLWRSHFAGLGVTPSDLDHLGQHIDGEELLKQRVDFDPGKYSGPKPKKRVASPFRRS